MSCNFECLEKYREKNTGIKRLLPGTVYAPFVTIRFGLDGDEYTVGNNSSPAQSNHACIKSFQYGTSNGYGCVAEILDEQGGSFDLFMEKINKRICGAEKDANMIVDFGWIVDHCNGNKSVHKVSNYGKRLKFLPQLTEASYSQGKVKFTINGNNLSHRIFETRLDTTEGSDKQKVKIKTAMERILKRCTRIKLRLERKRGRNGNDVKEGENLTPWGFLNSDGGKDGPLGVWPADEQNVLSVIRKWMNSFTTDRKLGVTPVMNPNSDDPEIIFLEDFTLPPNKSAGGVNWGTYIVGGGDCSPVIDFNPTAKWNLSAEGGNVGGLGGTSQRPKKATREQKKRGGSQTHITPPQNDLHFRPPEQIADKMQRAVEAQEKANKWIELVSPIEAELKIQGDPFYAQLVKTIASFVSLVVINPHHIFGGLEDQACGEWLALPPCNRIYSDNQWLILGTDHSIREGSYVTTLKLSLANKSKTATTPPEAAKPAPIK